MQAMRRFFARRGRCYVMYTDNGTNFVGTSRALRDLNWQEIKAECATLQIKWNFNPPGAPWYGGWWERMVRTIKMLIKKSLGRACVTYEEMLTLLCECESTINSRPTTYVSDDPNELKALKPSDFIQDIKGNDTVDLDIVDTKHLCKRIRYVQSLRQQLRRRFQEEYLSELIRAPQLSSKRQKLAPGDIVLIGSDNTKRLNWPLGRILELYPGKDNVERVAKLRVANGELIRPVQRIYPLEMSATEIGRDVFHDTPEPCTDDSKVLIPERHSETPELPLMTRYGRKINPLKRLNI